MSTLISLNSIPWKTITAAVVVGGTSVAVYVGWISQETANMLLGLAGALGLVGLRHAISKTNG